MPILVSLLDIGLFSIPMLVAAAMLLGRTTADIGKRILIYCSCASLMGLAFCWIGYALMLFLWPLERHAVGFGNVRVPVPFAIFWASGPLGIVHGAILARLFLQGER
jgi:hypothetical protein